MAVVKIIELVGSSTTSSDDAVKAALKDARATLRNIKVSTSFPSACAARASTNGALMCAWHS